MAENPACWTRVEQVIDETLEAISDEEAEDAENGIFRAGFSTPTLIAQALRHEGLLKDGV